MENRLFSDDEVYNAALLDFLDPAEYYQQKSNELYPIFSDSPLLEFMGLNIYKCGSYLEMGRNDDGRAVVLRSNYCRSRFCPTCQWRRSRMLYGKLSALWDSLKENGFDFLHVVLTVKNCSGVDLPKTIDKMQGAYRRMLHDNRLRAWAGAMRFCEVSYSNTRLDFHPHFHSLVVVRKSYYHSRYYVSVEQLRTIWREYLGVNYLPQVYISRADDHAINEVAKYCVKPFDIQFNSEQEERKTYEILYQALHGRRMYQAFGAVRAARADLAADPVEEVEQSAVLARISYDYRAGHYTRCTT